MNIAIISGNLASDPELKDAGGKKVCEFRVATNSYSGTGQDRKEYTVFHNIVAWERLAETCSEYLSKGRKVTINGSINNRSWDKDDGTKGYKSEIRAKEIDFGPRNDAQNGSSPRDDDFDFDDL